MSVLMVREIFGPTIQGEGDYSGSPAIFIRFAGCNMWNGLPSTRAASACPFCDTDFRRDRSTKMSVAEVLDVVHGISDGYKNNYLIVLTGGEPMLQNKQVLLTLVGSLQERGFTVQMESNGTVYDDALGDALDGLTISPKSDIKSIIADFKNVSCLKVLHPHPNPKVKINEYIDAYSASHSHIHFCLQPIDAYDEDENKNNINLTLAKVKKLGYPWRISLQTHKLLGEE